MMGGRTGRLGKREARCAARLCGLAGALALSACAATTGHDRPPPLAQAPDPASWVRLEAEGTPRFDDPALQAIAADFERARRRYDADPEALAPAGRSCPMPGEQAAALIDYDDTVDRVVRRFAPAGVDPDAVPVTLDAVAATLLSGSCGVDGPDGPVVLVVTARITASYPARDAGTAPSATPSAADPLVVTTEAVRRIEGRFADGRRDGAFREIQIETSRVGPAPGRPVSFWDAQRWRRSAAGAVRFGTYAYGTYRAGRPVGTQVTFRHSEDAGVFTTSVTEIVNPALHVVRSYRGGTLVEEASYKDGRAHGWQIRYPVGSGDGAAPGWRRCYQKGQLFENSTGCPAT